MNIMLICKKIIQDIEQYIISTYNVNYVVIGEGNINSNLLIIGEAMGREEEKNLRIFIGKSGYILRNTLNKNLISNFFIINTLPIRPYNNRTPTYKEILFFSKYYKNIIQLDQFKQFLILGKSASLLVDILKIQNVIKTFHPAYLLYNRYNINLYNEFENKIKQINQQSLKYPIKYQVIYKQFMI
ncbi:uracil-DNA glycosylase [uncultured bacterium]|nr:uracil-DNA glycosylase [uncultured bacterium]